MSGVDSEMYYAGGECAPSRRLVGTTQTPASGTEILTFFTAKRTEDIGHMAVFVKTAASGLTLAKLGVYTVDYTGKLTLAASTADFSATLNGATGELSVALSASLDKRAGQLYAAALIQIGTTPATLAAAATSFSGASQPNNRQPRVYGYLGSQTDLVASVADASLGVQSSGTFFELLP